MDDVNLDEYVTIDEFNELLDLELDRMIEELNQDLDSPSD